MLMAMIVLVLAWSIGSVCEKIGTAEYVINVSRGLFSPHLLPALTFLISAVISFSTGTSWATMAIVIPIVTPLSFNLCGASGFPPDEIHLNMVSTLSGVLAGSIFGDHCSPISDTTIMSSMASSVDHVDHVRTQLPYALLVGCVSIMFGDIPSGYGLHPGVSLVFCCLILVAVLRFFGKKVETVR
jgi:Na+/H+ antiporter NhaC